MSTTSDLRAYADIALEQGKQVLEQVQSQLSHVTDAATEHANDLVTRITGKSAPTRETLKSAAEPYVVQALEYGSVLSDRVEELLTTLKGDKRIGKFVESAEGLTSLAVVTVQDKVIKPVLLLVGQEGKAQTPATPYGPVAESVVETVAQAEPEPAETVAPANAEPVETVAPAEPAPTTVPAGKAPATSRPDSVQAKSTTKRAPAKKSPAGSKQPTDGGTASPANQAPPSEA